MDEEPSRFEWSGSDTGMDTSLTALRNKDASVTMTTRCGSRLQSVWLLQADARRLREWLCAQDLGPTRNERLDALRSLVREFERLYGPINPDEFDEAYTDGHGPRPLPKSMGMGKNGPADLSRREGFGG